jgi:hypothetical protein
MGSNRNLQRSLVITNRKLSVQNKEEKKKISAARWLFIIPDTFQNKNKKTFWQLKIKLL